MPWQIYAPALRTERRKYVQITWQEGPVLEAGVNGALIEDVIDVLVERLKKWNEGPLRCRENSLAITNLEQANHWLQQRTIARIEQGVEGTMQPHKSR